MFTPSKNRMFLVSFLQMDVKQLKEGWTMPVQVRIKLAYFTPTAFISIFLNDCFFVRFLSGKGFEIERDLRWASLDVHLKSLFINKPFC